MATVEELIALASDLEEKRAGIRDRLKAANEAGDLKLAAKLEGEREKVRTDLKAVNEARAEAEAALPKPEPTGPPQTIAAQSIESDEAFGKV